jgi:hypothetical protein
LSLQCPGGESRRQQGAAVPSIRKIAVALAAIAVASALAGCASAPPGSFEEQLAFDKATGPDVYQDVSQLRMRGIMGYPRSGCCGPGPVFIDHP